MRVKYSKNFRKQFSRLPPKKQIKVAETIVAFQKNPSTHSLRLHQLKGELSNIWSISAGGDLRIHFEYQDDGSVIFLLTVGTHSQLY